MATLKFRELEKTDIREREKKLKELKLELVKAKAGASKSGSSKVKQIKKMIAKIIMLNSKHGNMPKMWLA
jgi:ribosomal protein L29